MNGHAIRKSIKLSFTPETPDSLFAVWDAIANWYSGSPIF